MKRVLLSELQLHTDMEIKLTANFPTMEPSEITKQV